MRFHSYPLTVTDRWRDGLVVITENGNPEALLDVGKGATLSSVAGNADWLANQRHRPKIAVECSAATAARYFPARTP